MARFGLRARRLGSPDSSESGVSGVPEDLVIAQSAAGSRLHLDIGSDLSGTSRLCRRLSARIGKAKAVTATARKIAILFYNAMRFGMVYQDPRADHFEQKYRGRVVKGCIVG